MLRYANILSCFSGTFMFNNSVVPWYSFYGLLILLCTLAMCVEHGWMAKAGQQVVADPSYTST